MRPNPNSLGYFANTVLLGILTAIACSTVLSKCTILRREAWITDTYLNVILDSVRWQDHGRHQLYLSRGPIQMTIRYTKARMDRPRYRLGARYQIRWRQADGDPLDSCSNLRFELRPGWYEPTTFAASIDTLPKELMGTQIETIQRWKLGITTGTNLFKQQEHLVAYHEDGRIEVVGDSMWAIRRLSEELLRANARYYRCDSSMWQLKAAVSRLLNQDPRRW